MNDSERLFSDVLAFFDRQPAALSLYEAFARAVTDAGEARITVKKTQISFADRHIFACVSFLPVLKAENRPKVYIVVTFGLDFRLISPRVDAAVSPYPNRWTHHVTISRPEEIDGELMAWIAQARALSRRKR